MRDLEDTEIIELQVAELLDLTITAEIPHKTIEIMLESLIGDYPQTFTQVIHRAFIIGRIHKLMERHDIEIWY